MCVYIYIHVYIYIYILHIYIYTQCSLNRFCVCLVRTSVYRLILLVFGYTNKKPHIFYCEGYPSTTMILEKKPTKEQMRPKMYHGKSGDFVFAFDTLTHDGSVCHIWFATFAINKRPSRLFSHHFVTIHTDPSWDILSYYLKNLYHIYIYHPWKPHTDPSWVITTRNRSHDRGTLAGGISSRGSGRLRRHNWNRYALAKETEWPSYNA